MGDLCIVGQVVQAYALASMLEFTNSEGFKRIFISVTSSFGILRLLLMYYGLEEWQWIITGNVVAVIVITIIMAKDSLWKKALAISMVIIVTIISELAAEWTYPLPKPENMPLSKGAEIYDLWLLIHLLILMRGMIFLWKKYFLGEHASKNVPMIMIPLIINLYLSIAGCYSHFDTDYWDNIYYDTLLIPMMIPMFSILYVLSHQKKKEEVEAELEEVQHQLAMERLYYQGVEEGREKTARFRHDFNNRLMTARHLLENGETEEGRKMTRLLEAGLEEE